jgi:hypothetical protein
VPPELLAAMVAAQQAGDAEAVDRLADMGQDPAALAKFMLGGAKTFGDFDESKHPRAEDGKFGSGGRTETGSGDSTESGVSHPLTSAAEVVGNSPDRKSAFLALTGAAKSVRASQRGAEKQRSLKRPNESRRGRRRPTPRRPCRSGWPPG